MSSRHLLFALLAALLPGALWGQLAPQGTEFRVHLATGDGESRPDVAALPGGGFVVVWDSFPGSQGDPDVLARVFDADALPETGDLAVNTATAGRQWKPRVTADAQGQFVVAWQDYQGNYFADIVARRFQMDGTAAPEFTVHASAYGRYRHDVSAQRGGEFVVTYDVLAYSQVYGRWFDADGTPRTGSIRVGHPSSGNDSSVAAGPGDRFIVVWTQDRRDVRGRHTEDDGALLGDSFVVNAYTTEAQINPSVASDPFGNFVVVWHSHEVGSDRNGLFAQRFDAGGAPVGVELSLADQELGFPLSPAVAVDEAGNFVVVWQDRLQESGRDTFGRHFDVLGIPLGDTFQANAFSTGVQVEASVAALGPGRFVIAWSECGGRDPGCSIFANRWRCDPVPEPVENLRVERGGGSLQLSWDAAGHTDRYFVFIDDRPDGGFTSLDSSTTGTSLSRPVPDDDRFYLVAGRNGQCGLGLRR